MRTFTGFARTSPRELKTEKDTFKKQNVDTVTTKQEMLLRWNSH